MLTTTKLKTFGPVDANVLAQIETCQRAEEGAPAVLCADNHLGYSMPIGGVVGYEGLVSPSAVGYDIGCGNMAVRTDARAKEIDVARVMDDVWRLVSFGVGRKNNEPVEHPVLDVIADSPVSFQRGLAQLAAQQLGTVGSGNHYVDLFEDVSDGRLWVGVHFGSRGFGHKTATWALKQVGVKDDRMDAPPVVIPVGTPLGMDYIAGMELAGAYAYAGRECVVTRVLQIIGARAIDTVHNHHNYAWRESHGSRALWVHRKGATPAFPLQRGFVGGTMGEHAVILEGVAGEASAEALYSTVHGAGRAISRRKATGKIKRGVVVTPGLVDWPKAAADVRAKGVELRGAGADEAPECYKRLDEVLAYHAGTVKLLHSLRPIGVAMAGHETYDPYKD